MKKEVKKQIKEDKFVEVIASGIEFFREHKKKFFQVGFVIVCVVMIVFIARIIKAGSIKKENIELANILKLAEELKEQPDKLNELEALAGNSGFNRMAYIKLASYWIEQQNFEKAEAQLNNISSKKKDTIYFQAKDMLGQIYSHQKKYEEALNLYKELEKYDKDYSKDVILFHKAEVLEKKGDHTQALSLYKSIQNDFPRTYFGYEASEKVKKLEEILKSPIEKKI